MMRYKYIMIKNLEDLAFGLDKHREPLYFQNLNRSNSNGIVQNGGEELVKKYDKDFPRKKS